MHVLFPITRGGSVHVLFPIRGGGGGAVCMFYFPCSGVYSACFISHAYCATSKRETGDV